MRSTGEVATGAVSLCLGLYCFLVGSGLIHGGRKPTSAAYMIWHARYRLVLKLAGLGLVMLGLARLASWW